MRLEEQVCSLELSKKLKGLGVKQESIFYWDINKPAGLNIITVVISRDRPSEGNKEACSADKIKELKSNEFSAFTVAELGEMLPKRFGSLKSYTGAFLCTHEDDEETPVCVNEKEADARAIMVIQLLEKEYIKIGDKQ